MSIRFTAFTLCILATISGIRCQQGFSIPHRIPTMKYPFVTDLDMEGDYRLRWGFNDTYIWFEVQAHALGYVGFGISESGKMVPADVAVGYVSGGNVYLADYHTERYGHPDLDRPSFAGQQVQNWELLQGKEENGWTVLEFQRPLDTCDVTGDRPITRDTQHLIYSYSHRDPRDHNQLFNHDRRGSKAVDLLTLTAPPTRSTPIDTVEFRNNFTVPMADNAYHCRLFTVAGSSIARRKHHIVKIEPIFQQYSDHVRKLTMYRCRFPDMSVLQGVEQEFDCFRDVANHQQHCKEFVASFAPGSQDFYLPEEVGLPIGGPGMHDLYVLATDYDNVNREVILDTSGVRLSVTTSLRSQDAAFLSIVSPIANGWFQIIPPGEEKFTTKAYCPSNCFNWAFTASNQEFTILGAQFQGRALATGMRLRHLSPSNRQGTTKVEHPWILDNQKYVHEAQSMQMVKEAHRVNINDDLVLECSYDSTGVAANYTLGGWRETDELCRAHVLYYPPMLLEGCLSWSLYDTLRDTSGAQIPPDQVFSVLLGVNWRDPNMRNYLKQTLETSGESAQCWSSNQNPTTDTLAFSQPDVQNPYVRPRPSTCSRA